jgi:3-deoxy-D-manno-octulosonic acid kinase
MPADSASPARRDAGSQTASFQQLRLSRKPLRSEQGHGAFFVNPAADTLVTVDWFRPQYWISRNAVIARHTGRGAVIGFENAGRRYLLRHYLRGGLAAAFSTERYLWLGEARTRPLIELKLTLRLHADGMPVPRPVAVRYQRTGAGYTADIITDYLPATRTLAAWLNDGPVPHAAWTTLGRTIRGFHDWGLDHADLNAHNILLRDETAVFLIDFDRSRLRRRPGIWRDANLARLRRSLDALEDGRPERRFDDSHWFALLAGWFEPA